MEMLDRVKLILSIDVVDYSKDDLLYEFINNHTDAVNLYCGTDSIPLPLEFIVVECTVARYNRLGSEGLSQEQIDVINSVYQSDLFTSYIPYMESYKKSNKKLKLL